MKAVFRYLFNTGHGVLVCQLVTSVMSFLGGASQKVKYTVSPEALRRFIQKEGLAFRFDSTVVNACKEGPRDGQFMPNIWGDFWKNDWDDAQGTGEFWSYTKVYPNHGGTRCVYFVSTETLFYDWSSN